MAAIPNNIPNKVTVAPATPPAEAAPSVVVKNERKLEFMPEPTPRAPDMPKKLSARLAAEHAAGAEALANYQ